MSPSPSPSQLFLEKTHMCAEGTQGVELLSADTFPDIPFLMTSRLIPSGSVQADHSVLPSAIPPKLHTTFLFMKLHLERTEVFYYQGKLQQWGALWKLKKRKLKC